MLNTEFLQYTSLIFCSSRFSTSDNNSDLQTMALNGSADGAADPQIQEAFSKLSELEKDFAAVELDARKSLVLSLHLDVLRSPSCQKTGPLHHRAMPHDTN